MPSNDSYHHGNLKAAAVEEGLRRVTLSGDPRSLSLREIARALGVSATALYRHFPDKDALLGAIASRGFEMLIEAQRDAVAKAAGNPLAAAGRAYVHFAFQHSALFRMIFSCQVAQTLPFETGPEDAAAGVFARAVSEILGPKVSAQDRYVAELRAWAQVHGLTMLILDGQLRLGDIDTLMEQVITAESLVPNGPRPYRD